MPALEKSQSLNLLVLHIFVFVFELALMPVAAGVFKPNELAKFPTSGGLSPKSVAIAGIFICLAPVLVSIASFLAGIRNITDPRSNIIGIYRRRAVAFGLAIAGQVVVMVLQGVVIARTPDLYPFPDADVACYYTLCALAIGSQVMLLTTMYRYCKNESQYQFDMRERCGSEFRFFPRNPLTWIRERLELNEMIRQRDAELNELGTTSSAVV